MRVEAARKYAGRVHLVERLPCIDSAHGKRHDPIVFDAEDLDTGPGNRLIQPLTQIAGDLLSFIDDFQPCGSPA